MRKKAPKNSACIPDWLPDWRDKTQYPDPKTTTKTMWAWEFLRRNPEYQKFWDEHIAPYFGNTGYDGSVAPIKHPLAVIRSRFALRGPCLVPPSLNALAAKGIFFEGAGYSRLVLPQQATLPDGTRLPDIALKDTEIAVIYDLTQPLDLQLQMAARGVQDEQKRQQLTIKASRARVDKYQDYLRILDAKVMGASYGEILKALEFKNTDKTNQTVRDAYAAAIALRDGGYKALPITSAKMPRKK